MGKHRGNQPVGKLAQLGQRFAQAVLGAGQLGIQARVLGRQLSPRKPDGDSERCESLLRPVMQVPLERAALGVRRGDDASARRPQALEVRTPDGAEALMFESQARRVRELRGQRGVLEETRAVHDGRELAPPSQEPRDLAIAVKLDVRRSAGAVDPPRPVVLRVQQIERGIAERVSELVPEAARRR